MPQHTAHIRHCFDSRFSPVLALTLGLAATGAQAATPDAGVLRQQIERDTLAPLPPAVQPARPAEPQPLAAADGATVQVKSFRFAGNSLINAEQLGPVVAPWVGKTVSFAELRQATQAVAAFYREAGWVVRAYLPRQDVTEGVITIQIVEAVFGGTRHEGTAPQRVQLEAIQNRFAAQQAVGQPLNANRLDRALLLADDLPGVSVTGSLTEGSQSGQTDLVIKTVDEPLLIGEATADNHGARSTGSLRGTVSAHLNSPLKMGDLVDAIVVHTEGSDYGRLAWTVPVGNDGLRVGVNASDMNYRLVAKEFADLQGKGDSSSTGAVISYPLVRARMHNLNAYLSYDRKAFSNQNTGVLQSDYDIDNWTYTLSGNLFDRLGGGGANSLTVAYIDGRVDQGVANASENTAYNGHYYKITYAASRQQVINDHLSLYLAVSGQHADKDLDTSERFYLGGANGVRAYPSSEGGGSRGQIANLELRWRWANGLNLTGFYDWGHVKNFDAIPSASTSYDLKGFGLSAAWATASGLALKATWAYRDGQNPNPTASGNDQDGSLHRNRFWLSASLPF